MGRKTQPPRAPLGSTGLAALPATSEQGKGWLPQPSATKRSIVYITRVLLFLSFWIFQLRSHAVYLAEINC